MEVDLQMNDIQQLLNQLIRVGKVSSINPQNCTARVVFEDNDDLVSDELPILTRNTLFNKDYWMPDVNEQVLCLFLPIAPSHGFILGSFYSLADLPIETNGDIWSIQFKDGSKLSFNRATGVLSLDVTNEINIKSPKIKFTTNEFFVDSPKSIFTGNVDASNIHASNNIIADGDVGDASGSLKAVRDAFNNHDGHFYPSNIKPNQIANAPVTPSNANPSPTNGSTPSNSNSSGSNSFPSRGIDAALSFAPENVITEWVTINNNKCDYLTYQPLYLKRADILNSDGVFEGNALGLIIKPDKTIDLTTNTYNGYRLLVTYRY